MALTLAVLVTLTGCTGKHDNTGPANGTNGETPAAAKQDAGELPKPTYKTVACNVYTPDPGFLVLIDGQLVLDEEGQPQKTPCAVEMPLGEHAVAVVKPKHRDTVQTATITEAREFVFEPQYTPFADVEGYWASPLGQAKVGDEVALAPLNTGGPVYDPFVTPDGLMLVFAGSREQGRGIYFATRPNTFTMWGPPQFILASRTSDKPSSPTLTTDRLQLAYMVPEKNRIWGLSRTTADADFASKTVLRSSENEDEQWQSSQMMGDGKTLLAVIARDDEPKTLLAARTSVYKAFEGKWKPLTLPGAHPCLSSDGLRHYHFDGTKLFRATRATPTAAFGAAREIAEIPLANYVHRPKHRQYWVSHDEQWLYFADDPERSGNLYAVKFAAAPGWGFAPKGKPIAPRVVAVVDKPEPTETKPVVKAPVDDVDPRTLPLPYAAFRQRFLAHMAAWNFQAAEKEWQAASKDNALANDRTPLDWDKVETQLAIEFWSDLETALGQLKSGDLVRVGAIQVAFTKYADGQFEGTVKDQPYSRKLLEMVPSDLIGIVERSVDKSDERVHARMAVFLMANPAKTLPATIALRVSRGGPLAQSIQQRVELRKLHLIPQELARKNYGQALALVDEVVAKNPKSEPATQAIKLRDELYLNYPWSEVGRQRWSKANPGEFATGTSSSPNSYLVSPVDFTNFQLSLEWKTEGLGGQGGVYFHYNKKEDTLRGNAYKIHLANDYAIRGNPDKFSTGSLMGETAPSSNNVKPAGEWNALDLRVQGNMARVRVNGKEVLNTKLTDLSIKAPGFVALDGEFPGITYRKVLVFELPKANGR